MKGFDWLGDVWGFARDVVDDVIDYGADATWSSVAGDVGRVAERLEYALIPYLIVTLTVGLVALFALTVPAQSAFQRSFAVFIGALALVTVRLSYITFDTRIVNLPDIPPGVFAVYGDLAYILAIASVVPLIVFAYRSRRDYRMRKRVRRAAGF